MKNKVTNSITFEEIQANMFKGEADVLVAKTIAEVEKFKKTFNFCETSSTASYLVCSFVYKPTFMDRVEMFFLNIKVNIYLLWQDYKEAWRQA